MKIINKKHVVEDIVITTSEGLTYSYYGKEWEYIEYDKDYIYIKFAGAYPKDCRRYNKDQVISIEIG